MNRPLHTLTTGRYFEGPRWRDGFLWLVDSLARTVLRIDSNGHCETLCEVPDVPAGMGFLPTGWVGAFKEDSVVRVDREGHMTDRIALPGRGIACALGGADRRSLFCISAQTTHEGLARGESTSRVDMVRVAIPGAGHP